MWARPVSQPTTGRYPHMALPPSTVEMEIDEPGPLSFIDVPIVNSPVLDQATDQVREVLLKNSDSGTSLILQTKLAGCKIDAVIDTAAQVTVVSLDWIHSNRPDLELQSSVKLLNAAKDSQTTGWRIPQQDLVLGSSVFKIDVIAAPISDLMLLGLDVLKCYRIILDLGENTISVKDDRIVASGRKNGSRKFAVGQATMVRRVVVPSFFEQQVLVQPSCQSEQTFMLESSRRNKGLMVPRLLVTPTGQFPAVVRNDSERYVVLKKGHLLGMLTEAEEIQEDPESPAIRKTECDKGLQKSGSEVEVPEHLKDLLERSCKRLSPGERVAVSELLSDFQDVFSKGDLDIGCFSENQHKIDTGTHEPFKKRMRRTPLGFQEEEDFC